MYPAIQEQDSPAVLT